MSKKYTLYVVPHTHWDREWYASFQLFRLRLVRMMSKLLDLLERDPDYTVFNFDAQTVVLEDYLEVYPEQRERVKRLVSAGRLTVGPWYVQPDEFLISAESYVRNLLLGKRQAEEFGHRMMVGYIPDTFGHIAQLPQILLGFGVDTAMHFRGLDPAGHKSEMWWESPDGSRILLHHMSNIANYNDAAALADDWDTAAQDLRATAIFKAKRATTPILLGMNGVDQLAAREDLAGLLRRANEKIEDVEFIQGSFEDFWAALKPALDGIELETVRGELRDVPRSEGGQNFLLYNVLSSRVDNKLQNARTLLALENWAEPWCALGWTQNVGDYPHGHLWTAWKWLLQNHPHDSLGGCSVDAVHRQMATKFEWATEIADNLTEERFQLVAQELNLSGVHDDELALVVFNASPWARDEVITVEVDLPEIWLARQALKRAKPAPEITPDTPFETLFPIRARQKWFGDPPPMPNMHMRGIHIRPVDGDEIPVQIESIESTPKAAALGDGPSGIFGVKRVRVSFRASLPALGYATFAVKPDSKPDRWPRPYLSPNEMHNAYLSVYVYPNGTFDLTDLESGEQFNGLGLFEDGADNGDGYTYSDPLFDQVYSTDGAAPRISHIGRGIGVQRLRIEYDLILPVGLNESRDRRRSETVISPLQVDLILRDGSRRLEIEVTLENRAKDHRLRMLFPTDLVGVDEASSAMQFDVVTRPITPEPIAPDAWWVEDPPNTFPQHGWVDMSDKRGRALCVISEGVYEFGVKKTPRRQIALTLLRAVGYLGARQDPTTIIGGAGPGFATPEAQLETTLKYRLALHPHIDAWDKDEVWRQSAEYLAPPRTIVSEPHSGERPNQASWLQVSGQNAILSSVKGSEDGQALIVRLYNPSHDSTIATVTPPVPLQSAHLANLQEDTLDALPLLDEGQVVTDLPPGKIVTLRLVKQA